jgi:hypothetical protein
MPYAETSPRPASHIPFLSIGLKTAGTDHHATAVLFLHGSRSWVFDCATTFGAEPVFYGPVSAILANMEELFHGDLIHFYSYHQFHLEI